MESISFISGTGSGILVVGALLIGLLFVNLMVIRLMIRRNRRYVDTVHEMRASSVTIANDNYR